MDILILIFQSMRIGDAAYNQNWFGCDRQYKWLLTIMIMRSQKPACIRAPTFPPISFRTYMKVSINLTRVGPKIIVIF